MKLSLQAAAKSRGGQVCGECVRFPPPGHSKDDRSGAVWFGAHYPDGLYVHVFSPADDPLAVKDYVRDCLGLPQQRPGERRTDARPRPSRLSGRADQDSEQDAKRAAAERIFDEALSLRDAEAKIGNIYLAARGIFLCDNILKSNALRLHPGCKLSLADGSVVYRPTLVAKLVDIQTDEFRGIQRTFLKPDGSGKDEIIPGGRMMLGASEGAVCKLTADEKVETVLGIGEGLETTLSMRSLQEFGDSPIRACCTAHRLAKFPVLAGLECLWVAVDNDSNNAGQHAAQELSRRWVHAGCEVFLVRP